MMFLFRPSMFVNGARAFAGAAYSRVWMGVGSDASLIITQPFRRVHRIGGAFSSIYTGSVNFDPLCPSGNF